MPKTQEESEKFTKRRPGRMKIEKQLEYPKYIKHSMEYDPESMEKMTSTG
jgi:hypothetical protein